jgi:hypothetical protein
LKRRGFFILLGLFLICYLLLAGFSSYPTVTERDRFYLSAFYKKWGIEPNADSIHLDLNNELRFIRSIQGFVFSSLIGNNYPIPKDSVGSVEYYYKKGQGACYDRAILMEKILAEEGFKTRHIYAYFRRDSSTTHTLDLVKKRLFSHALLEVKTKNGWLVVDTGKQWMGLDEAGSIMSMEEARAQLKKTNRSSAKEFGLLSQLTSIPGNLKFVYGLYSRNGHFLKPSRLEMLFSALGLAVHPPDYNLSTLLDNII